MNVVITGTSSGLGNAIALKLGRNGFKIYAGVRKGKDLEAFKQYPNIVPIHIDLTDYASIEVACKTIINELGPEEGIDCLICNAGIAIPGPLELISTQELENIFRVNIFGHHHVIQTFLPLIRKAKGKIINISSMAAFWSFPYHGLYSATKYAIEGLSDSLRGELRPWDIKVVLIEPGSIKSLIWDKSAIAMQKAINQSLNKHLYEEGIAAINKAIPKFIKYAMPAERVGKLVLKIIKTKNPRTRYKIGVDSHLVSMASHLPDKLRDRFIIGALKLPKKVRDCPK